MTQDTNLDNYSTLYFVVNLLDDVSNFFLVTPCTLHMQHMAAVFEINRRCCLGISQVLLVYHL